MSSSGSASSTMKSALRPASMLPVPVSPNARAARVVAATIASAGVIPSRTKSSSSR